MRAANSKKTESPLAFLLEDMENRHAAPSTDAQAAEQHIWEQEQR